MSELARVEEAATAVAAARAELETAMREARKAGLPLRPIAEASGLSVEWVRRLTMAAYQARPPKWTDADTARIRELRERDADLSAVEVKELRKLRRRETAEAAGRRREFYRTTGGGTA